MTARTELFIITTRAHDAPMDNVRAVGKIEHIGRELFRMTGNAHAEAEICHWQRTGGLQDGWIGEVPEWEMRERFPWPGSNLGTSANGS